MYNRHRKDYKLPTAPPPAKAKPTPIQSTSHLNINRDRLKVLYQGPPGEGKTHNLCTWPGLFMFNFDKNLGTLAKFPNVPFVTITSWEELDQYWLPAIMNRQLTRIVREFADDAGEHPYKDYTVQTIGLDSLSFFCNMNKIALGDGGAKSLGYDGWDAYGGRLNRLLSICSNAALFNPRRPESETYHFVATVHESAEKTDTGVVKRVKPSVQGAMEGQLYGWFDAVLLTETVTKRVVTTGLPDVQKSYYVWAVDPQPTRRALDRLSRGDQRLPARFVGTYDQLALYLKLEGAAATSLPTPPAVGDDLTATNNNTSETPT